MIVSIFHVALILLSPFNHKISRKLGKKNALLVGLCLLTASTFGLGILHLAHNQYVFKWLAIVIRFTQGAGNMMARITAMTIAM